MPPAKPYFLKPIGDQHVDLDSHFTWHCDVRSNPASTFRWYKNGQIVNSDPEKFIYVTSNVITFSKLVPVMHDGMYQCEATNIYGTTLSEGQLRVLGEREVHDDDNDADDVVDDNGEDW